MGVEQGSRDRRVLRFLRLAFDIGFNALYGEDNEFMGEEIYPGSIYECLTIPCIIAGQLLCRPCFFNRCTRHAVAQITTFNSVCMKVLIYSCCMCFQGARVLPSITAMSTARTLRINGEEDPYLRVVLPKRDPMKGTDSERVRKVQRLKKMFY